ncbi:Taurine dioxygenase, alpha-ketoglutarate-dependent [Andreprevotia lacus DSM 23236]|uniref:Taurine dioxygenase, alpha-ketoglutarate-dependent n=2 Tax=Andreprevotia TaxID=397275 RepID=A0A1W1Y170_9NEIS|nr:Taurine dioxygenase, alpha-ketoglutarate-dependent [Andreprevotia lacus DSM 23236]
MQVQMLGDDFAAMITAKPGQALGDVAGPQALASVQQHGALLLRGFAGDLATFERFTQTVAARFIHNGNDSRESLGDEGKTRSVTPGSNFVGPHSEFSYMPFRPDVLFFYCTRPASDGGASLLWDGIRLWDQMPESSKALFMNRSIRYQYRQVELPFFAQFFGTNDADTILAALQSVPGAVCTRHGEHIDFEYNVPAQVYRSIDGAQAFSNSIAVFPQTGFDDASLLDPAIRADLLDIALRNTVSIDLQAGDVLIVDNWRAMHGRGAFDDPQRQICIRMGYFANDVVQPFSAALEEIEY